MSPEETLSTAAAGAPIAASIECPACGTNNTIDSKFCRHCGHLLRALPTPGSDAKKAAPPSEFDGEDDEDLTSPAEIDARRARQLLDRALLMSERGDLNAALLACRQAVALDHNHPEPYALLGTLLERNGDLRAAMDAYEHVMVISPDNTLERDSLNRLKARLDKTPAFNFNSDELFAPDEELAVASTLADAKPDDLVAVPSDVAPEREEHGIEARLPPTSAPVSPAVVAGVSAAGVAAAEPLVFEFDAAAPGATPSVSPLASALDGETVASVGAAVPPSTTALPQSPGAAPRNSGSGAGALPKIERRQGQRRQVNVPVATERRTLGERRVPANVTGSTFSPSLWPGPPASMRQGISTPGSSLAPATAPSFVAPLDFSFGATQPAPTPLWGRMLRGSSFYGRTLPLVAVGILGIGFLSWARSQAVARDANASASQPTTAFPSDNGTTFVQPAAPAPANPSFGAVAAPAPNNSGGFVVSNATPVPPQAPVVNQGSAPATNTSNPAPQGSGGNSAPPRANAGAPNFPLAPAPVPPAPATGTTGTNGNAGGNSGGNIVLPPPQTSDGGNPSPPIRVGSLGSSPLNPAGSPQEGRIRITQGSIVGRPAPPPRTGTISRGAERDAANAAAAGNGDRAINNLTNAINATGTDQGFLLQQRAMAFLDRGDSARAIEDFNAAIDAYQGQVNRGENVAAAQAGIRSARSGLNLALSRR